MDCIESSDLEEGEILENDNESLSNLSDSWSDEFGNVNSHSNRKSGNKENKASLLSSENYQMPPRKHKLPDKSGNKQSTNILDLGLEEVSSDGDCLSDDDLDYKIRKKKRSHFSGTVEDIMSKIGETISRKKNHCSHRKRKTRYSFDRYKDNYNLWRHKTSHAKLRKPRRRLSSSDSNAEEISHERKRKKKAYVLEKNINKPNIRYFDEARQTLLEKLKKQKAEEAKAKIENFVPCVEEVENSEIQEVEMGIESTNYVDNPPVGNSNLNILGDESNKNKEEEEDDDLDLIELRLAALESNSKQRGNLTNQKKLKSEEQTDRQSEKSEDMDLDRYELLLRAEALKTALLKKHQKRLNKAKEMENRSNSNSNNQFLNSFLPVRKEGSNDEKPGTSIVDVSKENTEKEVENEKDENSVKNSSDEVRVTASLPSTKKGKTKRKKRKSDSLQSNAKENTENTDALEEDDRTLRSQLLIDLLKKKSLKDSERKPVLTDSVQTSVNQLPVASTEPTEPKPKVQVTAPKKNSLQKVITSNYGNTTKPITVPIPIPKPEIQRIIVHLGSEDSSDENDAEENSTLIKRESEENVTLKESSESVRANNEKRVELLLSQTWQKIEKEMAAARNTHGAPEAVYKHLPLSQRLEYVRLKQKIAERERLKKMKEQSGKSPSLPSVQESSPPKETPHQKPVSVNELKVSKLENSTLDVNLQKTVAVGKNVPLNSKNVRNLNSKQKIVAINKINTVRSDKQYIAPPNKTNIKQTNQKNSLLQSSQMLISKLKLLLKKIKIEKTIEENYDKEISKLKNQINLFEKRKLEQKFKIKKLAEESSRTYKVIQQIANLGKKPEEEKVVNCKDSVGSKSGEAVKGIEESKGEIVKAIENKSENIVNMTEESRSEEITTGVEQSKKEEIVKGTEEIKAGSKANDKEVNESDSIPLSDVVLLDYNSPLQAFNKTSDNTSRVDPNVMVCQFDLLGVCKDKECTYQHFRNSQSLQCIPVQGKPIEEEQYVSK